MPFCVQEHAFLDPRRASSTSKKSMFSKSKCNALISCGLYPRLSAMISACVEGCQLGGL